MATRAELVDMVDNLAASLRNMIATHGGDMTEGDRAARSKLIAEAEQMLDATRHHQGETDEREDAYIAAAREQWCSNNLEIDDSPMVSAGEDHGAWVAAWVWVTDDAAGLEEPEAEDESEEG